MHDHNLDDLIIDTIEPTNSKTKSFLTIIALLIVVLIVAIILTKTLLKTPNNGGLAFEQTEAELIAPELTLKETVKPTVTKKEPSLSNIIESELKAPAVETKKPLTVKEPLVVIKEEKTVPEIKIPTVPKIVKAKQEPILSNITESEIKAPVVERQKPVITKEEKDAADMAYWISVQEQRKAENKAVQVTERVQAKKVPVPVTKKPKIVAKPVQKITVQKPVATKPVPKTVSTKRYYIQVGSFKNQPSRRFLSVIKNNGLNYQITKPNTDGMKKLLIGPYKDRVSVNHSLVRVKDRINKRAFILKR